MPESSPSTLISDDTLDELAARGGAIYEAKKAIREPEHPVVGPR